MSEVYLDHDIIINTWWSSFPNYRGFLLLYFLGTLCVTPVCTSCRVSCFHVSTSMIDVDSWQNSGSIWLWRVWTSRRALIQPYSRRTVTPNSSHLHRSVVSLSVTQSIVTLRNNQWYSSHSWLRKGVIGHYWHMSVTMVGSAICWCLHGLFSGSQYPVSSLN